MFEVGESHDTVLHGEVCQLHCRVLVGFLLNLSLVPFNVLHFGNLVWTDEIMLVQRLLHRCCLRAPLEHLGEGGSEFVLVLASRLELFLQLLVARCFLLRRHRL